MGEKGHSDGPAPADPPPATPFEHPFRVRFQDVDAAGIVFYARFFDYAHEAYDAFLRSRGIPISEALAAGELIVPLVKADAEYLAPLRYDDAGVIRLSLERLGGASATYRYEIVGAGGKLHATVSTTHVCVARKGWKAQPWPPAHRAALAGAVAVPAVPEGRASSGGSA